MKMIDKRFSHSVMCNTNGSGETCQSENWERQTRGVTKGRVLELTGSWLLPLSSYVILSKLIPFPQPLFLAGSLVSKSYCEHSSGLINIDN